MAEHTGTDGLSGMEVARCLGHWSAPCNERMAVSEAIFSYCSLKMKIDTDRYLGPEQGNVRSKGKAVAHVTTNEYGSPTGPAAPATTTATAHACWAGAQPTR